MKTFLQISTLVVCLGVLSACGKSDSGSSTPPPPPAPALPANQTGIFYYLHKDYSNGMVCDTGRKTFGSLHEMCNTLLNDAANNNCARLLREQDHMFRCRGNGGIVPSPQIPQSSNPNQKAVWCSVAGTDSSGELFSGFRNRDNQQIFLWDSRRTETFNLVFGAFGRYGDASIKLSPAQFGGDPRAEITVRKKSSQRSYSVRSAIQTSARLVVDDQESSTTAIVDCMLMNQPTAAQTAPAAEIRAIECDGSALVGRDTEGFRKRIEWNGQGSKEERIVLGRGSRGTVLSIVLSQASSLERANIEVESLDRREGKRVIGRGTLKTGFSMVHKEITDRSSDRRGDDVRLEMTCDVVQ